MGLYDRFAYRDDHAANLPKSGERLEFGVHRMDFDDRECPAWPKNPAARANAAYRAAIKRAAKDPRYVMAIAARQYERATEQAQLAEAA